jgi:hypothetical protein
MTLKISGTGGSMKITGTGGSMKLIFAAGEFDPSSLGNLSAWYKVDALGLSNGATVTSWVDSSGTGNDMNSYSGTPTYNASDAEFGGMPSVSFNGSSYLYKNNPTGLPQSTNAFSAYIVGYTNNNSSYDSMFGWGSNSNLSRVNFWAVTFDGYYGMEFCNAGGHGVADGFSSPVIISYAMDTGDLIPNGVHYKNNVLTSPSGTNNTLNLGTDQIVVGTLPGSVGLYNLNGKMTEMLIYNAKHTNMQRLQVTQYLASKYGISI